MSAIFGPIPLCVVERIQNVDLMCASVYKLLNQLIVSHRLRR